MTMTEHDKKLLYQDLCARMPYGVIVRHADHLVDSDGNYTGQFWYKRGYLYDICRIDRITTTIIESEGSDEEGYEHICDLERSLPYLRPMSSMTEEEKHELLRFGVVNLDKYNNAIDVCCVGFGNHAKVQDYLNSIHVDYRGLIEKGLAIEVTKDNNPYEL